MKWRAKSLEPFERQGESPYQVQHDLQDLMQDLVGIVRREEELERALEGIAKLKDRAGKVADQRQSRIQSGLAHRARSEHLLTVSEAIALAGLRAQRKPRRAFPRRLSGEGSRRTEPSIS